MFLGKVLIPNSENQPRQAYSPMSEDINQEAEKAAFPQSDFERITQIVTSEFQVDEKVLENDTPTYFLKWPQETKKTFLKLLAKLDEIGQTAFLRKIGGKIVLRVTVKP